PHRRQGDVGNFDDLYCISNYGNKFLDLPIKWEVPIPPDHRHGELARKKLVEMRPRIQAAIDAINEKVRKNLYGEKGWWTMRKMAILEDMARRARFLQTEAKGSRHPNGGGFVAESARVAKTAYVGPDAMVLDGARVADNACIKEFAIVSGPKTVISGNAKVGGRAWVFGDVKVRGNARILEAATVSTIWRQPWTRGRHLEGQAEITGSAVIEGEHFLHLSYATDQTITGGLVMDYTPTVSNRQSGIFKHGRFYREYWRRAPSFSGGVDAGALYANWQFNQPKAVVLEDAYVNNNGVLHGRPEFADDGEHRCVAFNGKDQYAEAPPSVADFGELTIDILIKRSAGKGGPVAAKLRGDGRLFDFGTGEDECFYLAIAGSSGKPGLVAKHAGKSYTITSPKALPANKWVRLRVEMDGSTAWIHIDGKQVAKKGFAFRPRAVFIGDRPEGNFIACGRNKDEFFKGRMDHFRIYRKVHDDFKALGPVPFPLTQMQEWSEKDQERSDAWAGRKRAMEAELHAGKYGQLQDQIKWLEQQKSSLYRTARLKELEARAREAERKKHALDRKIHDAFRALPETVKAEQEIRELRQKIDGIVRQIRQDGAYVKLREEIQACEKQRGET
ncbi:MAG: hypothetical protein KAX44_09055, partial [Candidatus Brocadiae bacterium]|nr:hypothetical protein [Candidatus Brocadiia bacterium]